MYVYNNRYFDHKNNLYILKRRNKLPKSFKEFYIFVTAVWRTSWLRFGIPHVVDDDSDVDIDEAGDSF